MNYVSVDEIEGRAASKYEAVVVTALRARQLNLLERKRQEMAQELAPPQEGEEASEEKKIEVPTVPRDKVIVLAMRELLDKKIKYKIEGD